MARSTAAAAARDRDFQKIGPKIFEKIGSMVGREPLRHCASSNNKNLSIPVPTQKRFKKKP
jgi:hypothetical protein